MNAPLSLQAAIQYLAAGLCPIPIRADGSKAPLVKWKNYQERLPTSKEVSSLFAQGELGIALICGKVSGNLETLDFETEEIFNDWKTLVSMVQPNLMSKLVITQTPGKYPTSSGRHVRYRVGGLEVPENLKLANHLVLDSCQCQACRGCREAAKEEKIVCLIETRGEGGYALAPGSVASAHPFNRIYKNLQGVVSQVTTISAREREILIGCAESFNQQVDSSPAYKPQTSTTEPGDRPGDIYNQQGDFSILEEYGWKVVSQNESGRCMWKRPGKDGPGISATSGFCRNKAGIPLFYVFSTNAPPFDSMRAYDPFGVLVHLEYDGDFKAAGRALAPEMTGKVTIGTPPAGLEQPETDEDNHVLFPIGMFPERLQEVIEGIAGPLGCPTDSVGGLMIAMASVGIGYTRTILLEHDWAEIASVYYVLVAYPGEGKSPILKKLAAPMYEWQRALQEQFKANQEDYKAAKQKHEADLEKGVESAAPIRPKFPHIFTTDVTTEKLANILNDQPRGVAMLQDELVALVKGMNQYKAGGQGRDRQFYLEAWSGGTLKVDRKSDDVPVLVYHPFITILGGIQPEMLGALRDEMGREDGFVHRFLFSCPSPRVLQPWGAQKADPSHTQYWRQVFQKLTTLSQHIDQDGTMRPWMCLRTAEAEAVWKKWYDVHATKTNKQEQSQRAVAFKNIGYAARLSLIMQMLRWATGESQSNQVIEPESVQAGCWLADYFSSQYKLVYEKLHNRPDDIQAQELLEWIKRKGGKVSTRVILRQGPKWLRKSSQVMKCLQDLQDRGLGRLCQADPLKPGPKLKWFEIGEEPSDE